MQNDVSSTLWSQALPACQPKRAVPREAGSCGPCLHIEGVPAQPPSQGLANLQRNTCGATGQVWREQCGTRALNTH